MSPAEVGFIGIALIVIFILFGVHVAFSLVLIGFLGTVFILGLEPALNGIALTAFDRSTSYDFAVVPLFLLMGALVSHSQIGKEAYDVARAWVGQFRGGLAMATLVACGLFAACCGSSLATAAAMGKIAYPEMRRSNYDSKLAVGTIASGGTLGILIPPSIGFILIGILTELSIGKLFMAGIIPGIISIIFYSITIHIMTRFNPALAPPSPKTRFKEKAASLKSTWPILLLFLLVIGGIYGGIFTATEAGGIGAFGALLIGLFRGQLSGSSLMSSLFDSAKMSAMILALLIGAFLFNQFLSVTRIPFVMSQYIVELGYNRYIVLTLILLLYIILGMVFDMFAVLILTIPIIYPTILAFGFNPIWFAVMMIRVAEIGMISPPFGMNLFGLAGTINVSPSVMYRGVTPFIIADIMNLAFLVAFPSLVTFLPDIMSG